MLFDMFDVARGDCKALGTPWTAEEVYAVRNLWIDPELVRKWVLNLSDLVIQPQKEVKKQVVIETKEELEVQKEEVEEVSAEEVKTVELEQTLEEIQLAYQEIVGKLPARYKNDKVWLNNKILSTKL